MTADTAQPLPEHVVCPTAPTHIWLPQITIRTLPVAEDATYAEYEVIPSQPKEPTPCA